MPNSEGTNPNPPSDVTSPRSEVDILKDLHALCTSPGYAYALAHICLGNDWIAVSEETGPDGYAQIYDGKHLTLTEIATVTALLASQPISLAHPGPQRLYQHVQSTHSLLHELHETLKQPLLSYGQAFAAAPDGKLPSLPGPALREPYFYTTPTAYSFQYRDFALTRYVHDDPWLSSQCGFTIRECHSVISSIARLQEQKVNQWLASPADGDTEPLPCFWFDLGELTRVSGVACPTIQAVLDRFVCPAPSAVSELSSVHDFNPITARPILRHPDGYYLLFQFYWLFESFYVSPAYWMQSDPKYVDRAAQNRGEAAETLADETVRRVFGDAHVHRNILVKRGKNQIGEIDVLVEFGDRAVVIEAKSKRLTLSARQGRHSAIERDFSDAIQKAYDQAYRCSEAILEPQTRLLRSDGTSVPLPFPFAEVYPLCVLAEHYPALSFQTRQFLKTQDSSGVRAPLVLDVFSLDTVAEFLSSPLRFLNYLELRALHGDHVQGNTELSLLGLHLHQNLWPMIDGGITSLHDDISASIDAAMTTRRLGAPGKDTPPGVLTGLRGTPVGEIIGALDEYSTPPTIDLGLFLLKGNGKSLQQTNSHISRVLNRATNENTLRTATLYSPGSPVGLTVQCVPAGLNGDKATLRHTCVAHKYRRRVEKWVGVEMRMGFSIAQILPLNYPWKADLAMDQMIHAIDERAHFAEPIASRIGRGVGRNEPCPCGSRKKFKRCCGS